MKRILLMVFIALMWAMPANAMICLDNTDTLEGGASVAAVVDYTVHGLVGSTFTNIAQGQLSDTDPSILYTAGTAISVVSVIFVNTHSSAVTVNFYLDPGNAGTPRRLIPKNLSLGAGYSMVFDGQRCSVLDASGAIQQSYINHAASHTDGTDDIQNATAAQKGLATASQITKLDGISDSADVSQWTTTGSDIYYNSGNVGIGTTAPNTLLHLYKSGDTTTVFPEIRLSAYGDQSTGRVAVGDTIGKISFFNPTNADFQKAYIDVIAEDDGFWKTGASIRLFTVPENIADPIERVRILGNGNVGIGTTSPGYKLEVSGTAHVSGVFTAGTKTFVIDHPLFPTDKLLTHASIEGPRHDLIYRGIATLKDGKGNVDIDDASGMTSGTFAALCQNVVVTSLQNQDSFDRLKPGPVSGAVFEIICENKTSSDKVAWVVMAERQDPLVKNSFQNDGGGHLIVETDKAEPTIEELSLLQKEVVETKDAELIGTTKTQTVDALNWKKGYLIQPECRGATKPMKTIEYEEKADVVEPPISVENKRIEKLATPAVK